MTRRANSEIISIRISENTQAKKSSIPTAPNDRSAGPMLR